MLLYGDAVEALKKKERVLYISNHQSDCKYPGPFLAVALSATCLVMGGGVPPRYDKYSLIIIWEC